MVLQNAGVDQALGDPGVRMSSVVFSSELVLFLGLSSRRQRKLTLPGWLSTSVQPQQKDWAS